MNLASLFCGIGGFDLGGQRAGFRTALAAEIEPQARSIFQKHFPSTEVIHDVRSIEKIECDVLTAGWPCQGNSVAGKRAGLSDPRSGLWGQVRRILEAGRPQWFLGENVPGLLSVNRGRDFGSILRDLAELGYGTAYRVLDAQFTGVPQRRRRVFIVGCIGNWRRAAKILFEQESLLGNSPPSREAKQTIAASLTAGVAASCFGGDVVRTLTNRHDGSPCHDRGPDIVACTLPASDGGVSSGMHPIVSCPLTTNPYADNEGRESLLVPVVSHCLNGKSGKRIDGESETFIPTHDPASPITAGYHKGPGVNDGKKGSPQNLLSSRFGVRRLTPLECERLQGFPDHWTHYAADGKELSDSARYRLIGNSVAVPCVEWILKRIYEGQKQ